MSEQFIPANPLNTAVLFVVFNRPETTRRVFAAIRQARPPRLYIAADGARTNKAGEADKVKAVRDFVMAGIDWPCEVKTLFRDKNLGCKYAPIEAINWFFSHEERGIILEDDCLPAQSFFWFCETLLDKYQDDMRIWHIGGNNFQDGQIRGDGSYYFSKYNHIWGWASWASRWQAYDAELDAITDTRFLNQQFPPGYLRWYWKRAFRRMKNRELDAWDYQWTFTCWYNKVLSILPNVNLISNIGFGAEATHTSNANDPLANKPYDEMPSIRHPSIIERNVAADIYTEKKLWLSIPLWRQVLNKTRKILSGH